MEIYLKGNDINLFKKNTNMKKMFIYTGMSQNSTSSINRMTKLILTIMKKLEEQNNVFAKKIRIANFIFSQSFKSF